MDFHGLSRRELQALCKLNKIPANITNVAMADALQSLDIVEGIEEYLNVSQAEAGDVAEQAEKVQVFSPKATQTRCRTSTRQRKTTETEKIPPTATRTTTCRGTKKAAGGVEESKNEMLETPAISSSRRKAVETSSCRNVSSQLDECEEEANEEGVVDQKVDAVKKENTVQKKEITVQKKEITVQKAYSTRRSTRVTEKKSAKTRVKKDSGKAVKIDSFMDDEVHVESEETNVDSGMHFYNVEGVEEYLNVSQSEAGDVAEQAEKVQVFSPKAPQTRCRTSTRQRKTTETEKIPPTATRTAVKIDSFMDDEVHVESEETNVDSDVIASPCEDESSEQNLDLVAEILDASETKDADLMDDDLMVSEEDSEEESVEQNLDLEVENTLIAPEEEADSLFDDNASLKAGESCTQEGMSHAVSDVMNNQVQDNASLESGESLNQEDMSRAVSEMNNEARDDNLMVSEEDSEEESIEQNLDLGVEKLDASEAKDDTLITPEEEDDSLLDDNASLESGESSTLEDMSHAVSDVMNNQVQEIDGSSVMASDMILDNSESDNETESDNEESLSFADEITTQDMEQVSENTDDESFDATFTIKIEDLKPELFTETNANEKADSGVPFTEEKSQFFVAAPCFPTSATPIKNATPFKNTGIVTDDKENIVVEGKKSKQEIDATARSLRQLKADSGVSFTEEKSLFFVSAPCFPTSATPIKNATPFKNTSIVTDDKENIVVEGKKRNVIDATALSLRQLRKQLKALSLKSNGNEDASKEAATTRPALQAICENQLVGGEAKN
nr:hypothetical protein [Tanacetum cinerariifolium]